MARRGDKIICDDSYCGKVIPEDHFSDGKHDPPKELQPFVEANRLLAGGRERGEEASRKLWTPQEAHRHVREGKPPLTPQAGPDEAQLTT